MNAELRAEVKPIPSDDEKSSVVRTANAPELNILKELVLEKNFVLARRLLDNILASRPQKSFSPGLNALAGRIFLATGAIQDSIRCWRAVLDAVPDNSEALTNLGLCLLKSEDAKGAIPLLTRLNAVEAGNLNAAYLLSCAYAETDRRDLSLPLWRQLVAGLPLEQAQQIGEVCAQALDYCASAGRYEDVFAIVGISLSRGVELGNFESYLVAAAKHACPPANLVAMIEGVPPNSVITKDVQAFVGLARTARTHGGEPSFLDRGIAQPRATLASALAVIGINQEANLWKKLLLLSRGYAQGTVGLADFVETMCDLFRAEGSEPGAAEVLYAIVTSNIRSVKLLIPLLSEFRRQNYPHHSVGIGKIISHTVRSPGVSLEIAAALKDMGRFEEAAVLYGSLVELLPNNRSPVAQTIDSYTQGEQPQRALAFYLAHAQARAAGGTAFDQDPGHYVQLARLQLSLRQFDEVVVNASIAISIEATLADPYVLISSAMFATNRMYSAWKSAEAGLAHQPDHVALLLSAGVALRAMDRMAEALPYYRQVVNLSPRSLGILSQFGEYLRQLDDETRAGLIAGFKGSLPEAEALIVTSACRLETGEEVSVRQELRKHAALVTKDPQVAILYARALAALNEHARAVRILRSHVQSRSAPDDVVREYFGILVQSGQYALAQEILEDRPKAFATASARLASLHARFELSLNAGRQGARWRELREMAYQRALRFGEFSERYHLPEDLLAHRDGDKRVLVCASQGVGDEIRYAALYPEIATTLRAPLTFTCDPRLQRLLARSFPDLRFIPSRRREPGFVTAESLTYGGALPDQELGRLFDDESYPVCRHFERVSLAIDWMSVLRKNYHDFGGRGGYLKADEALRPEVAKQIEKRKGVLRVGLMWRSGLMRASRAMHYTQLSDWLPLLRLENVAFYCLQYDECEEEIAELEAAEKIRIHRLRGIDLKNDFDRVGCVMTEMDMIVGPCVAAMELAGALGVPGLLTYRVPSAGWRVHSEDGGDVFHGALTPLIAKSVNDVEGLVGQVVDRVRARRDGTRA